MKNLSIIIAALSAGTAPMLSTMPADPTSIVQPGIKAVKSGQEAIQTIRQTYDLGGYSQFLNELHDSYTSVQEMGQLEPLAEMRSGYSPEWEEWEARALKLQIEKNEEMLKAVENQEKTSFVEQVLSAAKISDDAHQKAILEMADLRSLTPGSGKNSDQNRLIELDLEFEYKSLHIDLPGAPISDKKEKLCALRMEWMDKVLDAASEFEDASLKETVALYAENFDARLAQSWDAADLNGLTNGKRKPANGLEEKIASILNHYHEKLSDMSKQVLTQYEQN